MRAQTHIYIYTHTCTPCMRVRVWVYVCVLIQRKRPHYTIIWWFINYVTRCLLTKYRRRRHWVHTAVSQYGSLLHCVALCCSSVLRIIPVYKHVCAMQLVAFNELPHTDASVLLYHVAHCNIQQHVTIYCNTLQQSAHTDEYGCYYLSKIVW